MYNSLSNSNFYAEKIIICQNFVSSPHSKFSLNKILPNYNNFHINWYLKATCNKLLCMYEREREREKERESTVVYNKKCTDQLIY